MLTCGLIGLPACGKSTLFALLTGTPDSQALAASGEMRRVIKVPDPRVGALAALFGPKKVTYAQIEIIDIPGLVPGARSRAAYFLEAVRGSDALIFVLRGFRDGAAGHPNPISELGTLEAEIILADLAMVENRIERLERPARGEETSAHVNRKDRVTHAALGRVRDHLAGGLPYSDLTPTPAEAEALDNLLFLTAKPVVWVLNGAEGDLRSATGETNLSRAARRRGIPLVVMSAQVEKEIAQLPPGDAALFLADIGLEESGTSRLARAVYERLGLISFLTIGEDEVRAWTIRRGLGAREAAGKVHSDIERGFIRAEVIGFGDYAALAAVKGGPGGKRGSTNPGERLLAVAKEKALLRLEGKDYLVRDGDIIDFRFNV